MTQFNTNQMKGKDLHQLLKHSTELLLILMNNFRKFKRKNKRKSKNLINYKPKTLKVENI
jgi:hypothetical protein